MDSERRLAADHLFRAELSSLRETGHRLCEFTQLALEATVASKPVLGSLFHTGYLYAAVVHGCSHVVAEVNPRHVTFYHRGLGFEPISGERINARVNAPAVLLCASFAAIAAELAQHASGSPPTAARSILAFHFAPDEEVGVLKRLHDLQRTRVERS